MPRLGTCVLLLGLAGSALAGKRAAPPPPPKYDEARVRALLALTPARFLAAKKQWMQVARALTAELDELLASSCRPPVCAPAIDALEQRVRATQAAAWQVASAGPPSTADGERSFQVTLGAKEMRVQLRCAQAEAPSIACTLTLTDGDRRLAEYRRTERGQQVLGPDGKELTSTVFPF